MAVRRVLSAAGRGAPRLAALSTAPEAVPRRRVAEAVRPPVPTVDFDNAQEAYRSRRSWELARSLLVLRLCASPALLAHHEQVRGWAGGWAVARRPQGSSACPGGRRSPLSFASWILLRLSTAN